MLGVGYHLNGATRLAPGSDDEGGHLVKRKKAKWLWLALPFVIAAITVLAMGGRLKTAIRGSNDLSSVVTPAYRSWQAVQMIAIREYRTRMKDPRVIRDYLNSHSVRKLQIGAGPNEPSGWLNTDIAPSGTEVFLDATERFPFPDGSFQCIFSEHMIEHVPLEAGLAMLKECYRVLAPGGKVRTVTPNLEKYVQLLNGGGDPETQRFIEAKLRLHEWPVTPLPAAYIFHREMRDWGHQFIYDPVTLRRCLELAGFTKIKEYRSGETTDPMFQEVESRTRNSRWEYRFVNDWESMAYEAVR
jgi:predicted SAM-dependent methyltransferase